MTYYVAGLPYSANDIYHHGIKGQRWGTKNGPPYPIKAGGHSKSEQNAGWQSSLKPSRASTIKGGEDVAASVIAVVGLVLVNHLMNKYMYKKASEFQDEVLTVKDSDKDKHTSNEAAQKYFADREKNSKLDKETGLYKKTKEMTAEEDLEKVNPEFNDYEKATYNCGLCSMTYDMRRRGYDVTAGFSDDGLNLGTIESLYKGSKRQNLVGDMAKSSIGLKTAQMSKKQAEQAIATLSEQKSSRGVLCVMWGGLYSGGHAMGYEVNANGEFRIMDGQTNEVLTGDAAIKRLRMASAASAIRTDNCEPDVKRMKEEGIIR